MDLCDDNPLGCIVGKCVVCLLALLEKKKYQLFDFYKMNRESHVTYMSVNTEQQSF